METINQHEGENEKVNDKVNLLETENKILKNDIANKQKKIDSLQHHNNILITQQEKLTIELLTATSQNSCKNKKNDVVETEDNIRREETHAKSGMSKVNKSLLEKIHIK